MPKKAIDYSKTIIYKICCKDVNIKDCYVGHTTNFVKRKCQHKNTCCNENIKNYNIYVYTFIRENGGWVNWNMIEVEKTDCKDYNDACKRERYWIEKLNATLNKVIPTQSIQEWREKNKEQIKQKKKEYRDKNNDIIKQKQKEYYEENKDTIKQKYKEWRYENKDILIQKQKEYYKENKDTIKQKHKIYRDINKDIIKQKKKEYRNKNKDIIKEKEKEKIDCECGIVICRTNLARHKKSINHKKLIEFSQ